MKILSLLTCLFALPAALSAAAFEGKVDFQMSSGRDKPVTMSYQMKDGKIRMDMANPKGGPGGSVIMDPVKREATMLMDQQRMYMVMPLDDGMKSAASQKSAEEATLEKTGITEKILGYTAEKFISTYENSKTEIWLAEGLGAFQSFTPQGPMGGSRSSSAAKAWEKLIAGKPLFPLRVVTHDKSGKENFRMEATNIEKKTLSDSLFAAPADYQKFDMGGMMKGMMPGAGR